MLGVGAVLIFLLAFGRSQRQIGDYEQIKQLVTQWAPLIWMSPHEKYYPSSVETFFENVYLANQNEKLIMPAVSKEHFPMLNTKSLFLVTTHSVEYLKSDKLTSLHGHNPKLHPVPTYAVVSTCTNKPNHYKKPSFTVTYWAFYPYNQGKKICFIGNVPTLTIFGKCFGHLKTMGSHVGDWEHVTLSFKGHPFPSELYTAIHNTGGYYKYEPHHKHFILDSKKNHRRVQGPKLPPIVRVQNGHPVLFSANGSHGLWPSPGEHEYLKVPYLTDECGYGVPWKTWENLDILHLGTRNLPKWLFFKGKWGNPKKNCVLSGKLGLCEYTDGPPGILRNQQEFSC
ncbi:uncharacterized protein LOC658779 [Tribolium castaneum]|uniref:Vacuolar protein sorting-associated protein 62-like Protein n=1 Tax=Tribolium castaneum TaxID=7070 RepID=D6WBW1_TRICA|nr:PREDICTED: vacuolar protein sorting-associated protein 62 isoform X1 [Tribolium castaneum]XP_015832880.1 PREDICTED: vacuolar protein sorting-associated protein 62 isoform X1 [Tribolium castaneum]EEZ97860.1 Vacuolar protein sorting-associated protein 62-like Protein [Tribolium castaneum]|eukprot:XP_015832878.1 PREDICTED: vacuolar protein sorting-associated protein 62 isoform X1 [Tribolium castaneum]